jgi:hypothetical protein
MIKAKLIYSINDERKVQDNIQKWYGDNQNIDNVIDVLRDATLSGEDWIYTAVIIYEVY